MVIVGITGSRRLTPSQAEQVATDLTLVEAELWHVGDASGVDALAWREAVARGDPRIRYKPEPGIPIRVALAQRSTRMVMALAAARDLGRAVVLHAWPTRSFPEGLAPSRSWPRNTSGSGSWGSIALAVGLEIPVMIYPLGEIVLPDWLAGEVIATKI